MPPLRSRNDVRMTFESIAISFVLNEFKKRKRSFPDTDKTLGLFRIESGEAENRDDLDREYFV